MENEIKEKELIDELERVEREPLIIFHAYPLEMWFWRIAVPVALIISLIK